MQCGGARPPGHPAMHQPARGCVRASQLSHLEGENLQRPAALPGRGRPAGLLADRSRRRQQCMRGKSCTWYRALVCADSDACRRLISIRYLSVRLSAVRTVFIDHNKLTVSSYQSA